MADRKIEIAICCRDLPFIDTMLIKAASSKKTTKTATTQRTASEFLKAAKQSGAAVLTGKEAQVLVYKQDNLTTQWGLLHSTDVVTNTTNPEFKPFTFIFNFEHIQHLRFDATNGSAGTVLCSTEISAGEIVSGGCNKAYPMLDKGKEVATIVFNVEEQSKEDDQNLTFNMRGIKLSAKDAFGKSDPFIVVSRQAEGGSWVQVCKTEYIKQNLNPVWHPLQLTMDQLNSGDLDRLIKFECFDYDKGSKPELIGEYVASYNAVVANGTNPVPLVNPKKAAKDKKYKNSGQLVIETSAKLRPSFFSYMAAKFHIDLAIFIDYTASNEPHTEEHSLHFLSAKRDNVYQQVLKQVVEVILPYATDTHMFGFGAKVLPTKKVSHCFSLNVADPSGLVETSLQGILKTYALSLDNVIFYGPTYFVPLLTKIKEMAEEREKSLEHKYLFAVIITDGELDDLAQSCKILSQICTLPVSLLIVGVGTNRFTSMKTLDDDEGELGITRDIVQFVPFNSTPADELASEMLGEIPKQYVDYMMDKNIVPPPSDGKKKK